MFRKLCLLTCFIGTLFVYDNAFAKPSWLTPRTCVGATKDLGYGITQGTRGVYWGTNAYSPPAYVVWEKGGGYAGTIPDTAPFDENSPEHSKACWVK